MSATTLLSSLFQYKAWANQELFAALQSLDETAHEGERHTVIRILNHIYVVDRIFAANLLKIPHEYTATNTPETPSLEDLRAVVFETDLWYEGYVVKLKQDDLNENIEFVFTDGTLGRMSREEMLAHVVTHGGYHRGAVGRIMAQLSIAPPRDSLPVFLHRSEPARRDRADQGTTD